MIFRNLFFGALLLAATAFAQPADSTIKTQPQQPNQLVMASTSKADVSSALKKQQKIIKNTTTWSKIKDLFE